MALISVLPQAEAKQFDEPPIFDSIGRKRFFDIAATLQDALDKLRTPANIVCFLVSYAYFKARKRFYDGEFHLMRMMSITFAPRIKNLSDQTLYAFKSAKTAKDDFITLKKYLNTELIKQNWDDILRFAAAIKLRYASSSRLCKRLNPTERSIYCIKP